LIEIECAAKGFIFGLKAQLDAKNSLTAKPQHDLVDTSGA
jgi:hypothetical protein